MIILLLFCFLTNTKAYDKFDLQFFNDAFVDDNFFANRYNFIVCHYSEVKLIKMISKKLQSFVGFHKKGETLEQVIDEPVTFIMDFQCLQAKEILTKAQSLKLFRKPFQWILISQEFNISEHWNFLEMLPLLIDSDAKIVERSSDNKMLVTSAYKISRERNLLKEFIAEWTPEKGLAVFNNKKAAIRRLNLQQIVIPSSLVITDQSSLKHLDDFVDRHIDTTSKVSYNVVRLFDTLLNSSITYRIVDTWGVLENGSWTGMLGDIEHGISEIGAAPLFLQKRRLNIIEYYAMVNPTGTKFIFLSPPLSYSNNIFIMPFDTIVWFCCFGMVLISCLLLFTALNLEVNNYEMSNEKNIKNGGEITFAEIIILNIGAICLQGTVAQTKGPAARIITLFLYFSYMFLYISYSASIVAILQSSDKSIQTLADILNSPLRAGAEDIAYSRYYFKTADDEVRKAIYRLKIAPQGKPPNFLPVEEGIKEVRKGLYAYHVEASAGYQIIQKTFTEEEKCGLQETRNSFLKAVDPWLVMKKKTPYAEILKIGVKRIIETGFKSRYVRRYYSNKPVCSAKSSRFVSVGIYDCYYAFMLLSFGTAISVCILIAEIGFNKYVKKKRRFKFFER